MDRTKEGEDQQELVDTNDDYDIISYLEDGNDIEHNVNDVDDGRKEREKMIIKLRNKSRWHSLKAEELNKMNIMAYMNHGYFSALWGDYKWAKRSFRSVLTNFNKSEAEVSYYYNVAYTYYRLNNDSAALTYFKQSLERYPIMFGSNGVEPMMEFSSGYTSRRNDIMPPSDLTNTPVLDLLQSIISSLPVSSNQDGVSDRDNIIKQPVRDTSPTSSLSISTCKFMDQFGRSDRLDSPESFTTPISLARCFNHIATSLQFLDKNDEAFEFYSKALSENNDLPNVHYGLAWLYNSIRTYKKRDYISKLQFI